MGNMLSIVERRACHDAELDLLLADPLVRASLCPDARVGSEPTWQSSNGTVDCVLLGPAKTVLGGARVDLGTLAFFIGRSFWSCGYAHRLVGLLLVDWDATEGHSLAAQCANTNLASQRVLLGNGFRFSGRMAGAHGVNLRFERPSPAVPWTNPR